MIKGSICQDIATLNVYVPYDKASNYMEKKLLEIKGEMDKFTTMLEISTFLSR